MILDCDTSSRFVTSEVILRWKNKLLRHYYILLYLSVAGSRFTVLRVALTGRVPGAQWTRHHSVDETIFMCGIHDYRARRVLFAVQLQDRGAHRARYVTAYETFENVVITLFNFEQGTDENYYDFFFFTLLHTSTASRFLILSPGLR